MINIIYEETFHSSTKKYIKKTDLTQKALDKTINLFTTQGESYNSLEFTHITCKLKKNYYSIRVTKNFRILLKKIDDENYIFEQVTDHKTYDKLTKPQNC